MCFTSFFFASARGVHGEGPGSGPTPAQVPPHTRGGGRTPTQLVPDLQTELLEGTGGRADASPLLLCLRPEGKAGALGQALPGGPTPLTAREC